ncbi:SPOR domain-containing protein [Allosphingosinicella indica]|uniref:Flp pilus assembly protein TadD, contains TPR repeats n=1 Tax=Allosphingosinicella indica TaxID=941907 RepID=A0A1X7H2Q5_9SPHN|nr:tetratricopeptide repeat protein [Allosphingosinicella indica]SMF78264.1 Flp pilus assembly protein TadD, contains TPR repeats [Allosphingosinicella indica]
MIRTATLKIAASTLILGMTMVGCTTQHSPRIASASAKAPAGERQANKLHAEAYALAGKQDYATALERAEQAVELAPRDAGYRLMLADLYLKNGRYASAETAFSDVLTLAPDNNRAALSLALIQIALGKTYQASARLDSIADRAAASDVGLAYALAGRTDRAIALLERAAREHNANGRTRQNLALAYALSGDWQKARVTAAQDVSPIQLERRMEQWSAMAKPAEGYTQVATLLGVQPVVDDAGQPARLALAPAPIENHAFAAAEPQPAFVPAAQTVVPVADVPAAPVTLASSDIVAPVVQPAAVFEGTAANDYKPVPRFARAEAPAVKRATIRKASAVQAPRGDSPFVVQIGAYSTPGSVERAWDAAQARYRLAESVTPLTTTVTIPGRGVFHRLAVSGFESRSDANDLCASIKAKGGACFVRTSAGDAPVRWASRNTARG